MERFRILITLLLFLSSAGATFAYDKERAGLTELTEEIDFMLKRIEALRALERSDDDPRQLRFHYDELQADLLLIREGIGDYIEVDIRQGRDPLPVDGVYR